MNEITLAIYKKLPSREFDLLLALYNHRCLDCDQIYTHFYTSDKSTTNTYSIKRLIYLTNNNILDKVSFEGKAVYFLTSIGVEFVKTRFLLPSNVYDEKKNVIKRGYFRASELKLSYKNIRHQLALNDFALNTSNPLLLVHCFGAGRAITSTF